MINLFTDMFISMKHAELHHAVQPLDFFKDSWVLLFTPDLESMHVFLTLVISNQKIKGHLKFNLKKEII